MSTTSQLAIPGAETKPENGSTALMSIIEKAVSDPSFDAAKLAVLLDVKLKWEADEARKEFEHAFQQFKRNLPDIFKTKKVEFPTSGGKNTTYSHAELDKITPLITESLLAYGITHYWDLSDTNGKTTVTCVLEGYGHTRRAATLCGPPDTSGGKNNVQAIGSTVSYLQRYSLLAACGIAAKGQDDDGRTEGMDENAVLDYVAALKDASDWDELRTICKEAVEKANKINDASAKERFRKVFEDRKKELREFKQ